MNTRKRRKLQLVAYHEAGHAVASYLLKRGKIRHASIIPDDHSAGRVWYSNLPRKLQLDAGVDGRTRNALERSIMVSLAGDAAENKFRGRTTLNVNQQDYDVAVDNASYLAGDPDEAGAYVTWLYYKVRSLLSFPRHWAAVKALAVALMEREKMGREEVVKIVKQAIAGS